MKSLKEVKNYIEENNVETCLSNLFDEETVLELEKINFFVDSSNAMYDLFLRANTFPYAKINKEDSYDALDVIDSVNRLRILSSKYNSDEISESEFNKCLVDSDIAKVYAYINTYLINNGYDTYLTALSNLSLGILSDNKGLGIGELFLLFETLDMDDFPIIADCVKAFYDLRDAKEEYGISYLKDEYNEESNDALKEAYESIVRTLSSHVKKQEKQMVPIKKK